MSAPTFTVTTSRDSFGRWHARVDFSHTLSESDTRPDFNLDVHWPRIRRVARDAIRKGLNAQDDGAGYRLNLDVHKQYTYSDNTWHGVEFIER